MDFTDTDSALIATAVMAAVFVFFAVLELVVPHRAAGYSKAHRWFTNLGLFAIDTVLVRVAIPLLMVGTAALAHRIVVAADHTSRISADDAIREVFAAVPVPVARK